MTISLHKNSRPLNLSEDNITDLITTIIQLWEKVNRLELELVKFSNNKINNITDIPNLRFWRKREDGNALIWEYESTFGQGTPNWVEYIRYQP